MIVKYKRPRRLRHLGKFVAISFDDEEIFLIRPRKWEKIDKKLTMDFWKYCLGHTEMKYLKVVEQC